MPEILDDKRQASSSRKITHWIGLTPHLLAIIIGILALREVLPELSHGVTGLIDALDVTDPSVPSFENTDCANFLCLASAVYGIYFRSMIGFSLLIGALLLFIASGVPQRRPVAFIFFPIFLPIYAGIIRYIILILLEASGGILGEITAFVFYLASVFGPAWAFAHYLEVYHGVDSLKTIWKRVSKTRNNPI